MTANKRTGFMMFGVAVLMLGMAYASVPLYRIFCQVTGFGGTTQRAEESAPFSLQRRSSLQRRARGKAPPCLSEGHRSCRPALCVITPLPDQS